MPTVYVTVPRGDADEIAHTLVEEEFAACVNAVDCRSVYRWDGEVHNDDETILIVKTAEGTYEAAVERIVALHPYDVPCIERFDSADTHPAFERWLADTTRAG
jgi:Uncharacterized protein involved in tolerance to divalent cations